MGFFDRFLSRSIPAENPPAPTEPSASGGGVLPVTRVDGQVIGSGVPGPITQRLVDTYWAWHRDPRLATPVDYGPDAGFE